MRAAKLVVLVLAGLGAFAACGGKEGADTDGAGATASGGAATGGASTDGGAAANGTGAGTSTGGTVSAEPIPIEDLCPIFRSDLCLYLMECGGLRYRDAAHCEQELDCYGMNELLASDASGAVEYDPTQVGACHARFVESPCTFGFFLFTPDIYEVLSYCPGTLTPRLEAGDACSSDGECVDGLYCDKGDTYQCPGTCRAYAAETESCGGSIRCADGLTCGDSAVCEPEAEVGSPCDFFCNYSVSCPTDEVCPTNLWCDRSAGQCQSGRLENEPCGTIGTIPNDSTAECAIHLWCDALDTGAGTCRRPSALGGPCVDSDSCADGLHCTGAVPYGTDATLGTCATAGAAGAECLYDEDCEAGLTCVEDACAAPGPAGAPCSASEDCLAGLVCRSTRCVQAPYPGEACTTGDPDLDCVYSRCVDGTCEVHARVGDPCTSGDDCATGECVDGTCYDSSVCNAPE